MALAGCGTSDTKKLSSGKRSKEYFAESIYGVKASPRVTNKRSNLPRGGGRDQLGKPYKVRGKMYYPKEDRSYSRVGGASWYGDAFHGRLTANGEIYDMTHLTAAHPTMPLPSYARVTNLKNGSSIIVRVNDRGPYHDGRIIDLSRRAAELLDYTRTGTAEVKVDYIGRAPLHGRDDQFLMASYRPGNKSDPSDGLPTGVMIAMAGPTPSEVPLPSAPSFPGSASERTALPVPATDVAFAGTGTADVVLPAFGPIAPERPTLGEAVPEDIPFATASLSYAPLERQRASAALDAFERVVSPAEAESPWTSPHPASADAGYVAAGSFMDRAEAERLAEALSAFGRVEITPIEADGVTWFGIDLYPDGRNSVDSLLELAWQNGAPDALPVRD